MMLIAVNCFEIDAASNTDVGAMGTRSSRLAIPNPRSYTSCPPLLIPTLHPGESGRAHFWNNWLTSRPAGGDAGKCEQPMSATVAAAAMASRALGVIFAILAPVYVL